MKKFNLAAIIIFALFVCVELSRKLPKTKFKADKVVRNMGYPVEIHEVTTPDGYILTIHRVPHGKNSNKTNYYPVLLMHGMISSTDHFILPGENKATLFYLVERGYDVWLGNARGNKYSRRHITLDPDTDGRFWQFSWHEIGTTDLTTKIDYILEKTKKPQLHYIGHSQGTTSFFVMASEKPEYNNKIKLSIQLAPSVFMRNTNNPFLALISHFHYLIYDLSVVLNINELIPYGYETLDFFQPVLSKLCGLNTFWAEICANVLFLSIGYDSAQLNRTTLPAIINSGLSTISTKQAIHYLQSVASGKFRQFDYGPRRNSKYYHSQSPPEYNLKNVISPVALFYGNTDMLQSVKDVRILRDLLPNLTLDYLIPLKQFNHWDFLDCIDLVKLINEPIYNLMKEYEKR